MGNEITNKKIEYEYFWIVAVKASRDNMDAQGRLFHTLAPMYGIGVWVEEPNWATIEDDYGYVWKRRKSMHCIAIPSAFRKLIEQSDAITVTNMLSSLIASWLEIEKVYVQPLQTIPIHTKVVDYQPIKQFMTSETFQKNTYEFMEEITMFIRALMGVEEYKYAGKNLKVHEALYQISTIIIVEKEKQRVLIHTDESDKIQVPYMVVKNYQVVTFYSTQEDLRLYEIAFNLGDDIQILFNLINNFYKSMIYFDRLYQHVKVNIEKVIASLRSNKDYQKLDSILDDEEMAYILSLLKEGGRQMISPLLHGVKKTISHSGRPVLSEFFYFISLL